MSSWFWLVKKTHTQQSTNLEANGTDVVVLFQLSVAGCGETFDLVYRVSSEQEALPAQLGSEPHVIIWVNQDDGASHDAPLPKDSFWDAVAHHTNSNLER